MVYEADARPSSALDDTAKGFTEGERIAKLSTFTLLALGVAEILVGHLSGSVSVTADGTDSLSDAAISLIVWLGLRFSRKAPDEKFNFGYLRVESFSVLVASLGMITVATALIYLSYLRLLHPTEPTYAPLALVTLVIAGTISLYRAVQMRRISKKYNLLSLKTDANNSIKDGSASFIAFGAVLAWSLGLTYMDAVGGFIVAIFIYSVSYVSIKESSLILLDAFHRPELVDEIRKLIEKYGVEVSDIKLRGAGPYAVGVITIVADGGLTLNQLDGLRGAIRADLRKQIQGLRGLSIVFHARKDEDEEGKRKGV
jgi:cation diffusion facilitator family transporter